MSRNRFKAAFVFLSAAAFIAVPGALAASPQTIYRDYADNGRLDGTYSRPDLERALSDAVVQAYTGDDTSGLKPEVEKGTDNGTGTSGGSTGGGSGAGGTSPGAVQTTGGLPFTGLDLSLIVAGALGLMLLGGALRRFARQRN
jgi:hypothetical protein